MSRNSNPVDIPWGTIGLGLLGLLVLSVIALPTAQGILYAILVGTPGFVQWTLVALGIMGVAVYRGSVTLAYVAFGFFLVFALLVGPILGGAYAHTNMANEMQDSATELDTLPNTSTENVRVLPRSVSDNFASSSMQYPRHKLTGSDITYRNGGYSWSYGLQPDSMVVKFTGNQKGALYVDMTQVEKNVSVEETEFKNGRGQLWFDSYTYQSVLHAPLKAHNWDTTFNSRVGGTSYIAHSTTTYEWRMQWTPIPQLYAIPHHETVEVMYQNGSIESMSPQEAQDSKILRGQNFYPYSIAMFKVESMKYVHGAWNAWFVGTDVPEIANLKESNNSWPITVPTESDDGEPELTYFVATEPTGSGNGVYQVWTIDSQTGDTAYQQYSDSQIGPQKAVDFVEREPQVNRLSNADAVSPIPIVQGDTLYWHVKVVPKSLSGVLYTAFVNAETGDVTLVEGTEPIYGFLTEEEVSQVQQQTQNKTESSGTTVKVVVTDGNGTITGTENITVPEGGDVSIDIRSDEENNSTATA